MKKAIFIIPIILLIGFAGLEASDWKDSLEKLIYSKSVSEQNNLIGKIIASDPAWQDVADYIKSLDFPKPDSTGFFLYHTICIDSVRRPYVIYLPSDYDAARPTPLLVVLHGGAGRKDIYDDPIRYAREHDFSLIAEKHGWILLFPFAQDGATWWQDVGMINIWNLVRFVKQKYNVDDDRVWMGGFSDGGSASFLHAMIDPNDYAAFIALNGSMGVGSLDGNLPTYAPNFYNTPTYAITTRQDRLYPSSMMRRTIKMAKDAGGDILYKEYEGGHDFDSYGDIELPLIAQFLMRHRRDPFPPEIIWETAEPRFGQCRWFAIDEITIDDPAPWHIDYNTALLDSTVTIGFMDNDSFEGPGVKVDRIVDGDYLARRVGLQADDIIIKGDDKAINTIDDLTAFKSGVKRGEAVTLTIIRNSEEKILEGSLPEPSRYFIFKREKPSAMARVTSCANVVNVESSRVGAFRIMVHPEMFRPGDNLIVINNGDTVFNAPPEIDMEFLLRNFLQHRDRKMLYISELKFDF